VLSNNGGKLKENNITQQRLLFPFSGIFKIYKPSKL